jgi:hypothetical protein
MAGGAAIGGAAWIVGGLIRDLPVGARDTMLIVSAIGLLVPAGRRLSRRLPQRTWQVPQHVFAGSPAAGSLRFGWELGLGFRTYVSSPWAYVALLTVLLYAATPWWGLLLGIAFGAGRGLLPVLEVALRTAAPEDADASWGGVTHAVDLLGMAAVVSVVALS